MASHSSILAWRLSWTEEPGGLQSDMIERLTLNTFSGPKQHTLWLTCPGGGRRAQRN